MKKVLACFQICRKNGKVLRMLFVYFLAQIVLSGLASFVIPFFSNKVFAENYFSNIFYACMGIWLVFALISALLDYYGNSYNMKAYYRLNEVQYKYQMERFLQNGYKIIRKMQVEDIVSRLLRDTQMMTNIVIWTVGVFAMLTSFLVVLIWGFHIYPAVLFIFIPQCMISSLLKMMIDRRIAVIKDQIAKKEDGIKEYHLSLNQGVEIIREDRFFAYICEKIRELRKEIYRYAVKENILRFLSELADYGLDICAKVLCIFVFYRQGCFDGAVIMPFFTVQATFRNQFLGLQDYISSIRQNEEAVERIVEITNPLTKQNTGQEDMDLSECKMKEKDGEAVCILENTGVVSEHKWILDNIDLCIKRGEKVAIVGENGSGKTTLLRVIMGLIHPDVGKCMTVEAAYSPVNMQLFPETFEENVDYVRIKKGKEKEQREIIKNQIFTQEKLRKIVDKQDMCQLSGGQQKIIAHLRAMLSMREIMIVDEPLAALDVKIADWYIEMLRAYTGTLIVATHDQRIFELVDRIVRIEKGRIVEDVSNTAFT